MAGPQDPTSRFYADNAETYVEHARAPSRERLDPFLACLPNGAEILELGCGNGRDSAEMLSRGFRVAPTDGIAEIATEASRRLNMPVSVLRFEEIAFVSAFDGIWANACLLHVPRIELGAVLGRIHRALRPGGAFYASFKAGEAEGQDRLGRYYNYPSEAWLKTLCSDLPWRNLTFDMTHGGAYDGQPTDWLHLFAVKA